MNIANEYCNLQSILQLSFERQYSWGFFILLCVLQSYRSQYRNQYCRKTLFCSQYSSRYRNQYAIKLVFCFGFGFHFDLCLLLTLSRRGLRWSLHSDIYCLIGQLGNRSQEWRLHPMWHLYSLVTCEFQLIGLKDTSSVLQN